MKTKNLVKKNVQYNKLNEKSELNDKPDIIIEPNKPNKKKKTSALSFELNKKKTNLMNQKKI